jgi:hypothetical protein
MKFEIFLLYNNVLQCSPCQAFWRFRLFIWSDKLSSPLGHCFFGSEYWHARAGDPLYCVRKAAARSLHYASISSALIFTKIFFHNILDTIRIFFLFSCNVLCLVSRHALLVSVVSGACFFKWYWRGRSFPALYIFQTKWRPVSIMFSYYLSLSGGGWLRHYATRLEVTGSIPCRVFGNFLVTSFCPYSVALEST